LKGKLKKFAWLNSSLYPVATEICGSVFVAVQSFAIIAITPST